MVTELHNCHVIINYHTTNPHIHVVFNKTECDMLLGNFEEDNACRDDCSLLKQ